MTHIYILRGLPGSGKSTLAHRLADIVCEADQFFIKDGRYEYDDELIAEAHDDCKKRFYELLKAAPSSVAVANTFTTRWELLSYFDVIGRAIGLDNVNAKFDVTTIDLFDAGLSDAELCRRNIHGVPLAAISSMRRRYQRNIVFWSNGLIL